jgi:uncharacterized protein (UPF0303 family)
MFVKGCVWKRRISTVTEFINSLYSIDLLVFRSETLFPARYELDVYLIKVNTTKPTVTVNYDEGHTGFVVKIRRRGSVLMD